MQSKELAGIEKIFLEFFSDPLRLLVTKSNMFFRLKFLIYIKFLYNLYFIKISNLIVSKIDKFVVCVCVCVLSAYESDREVSCQWIMHYLASTISQEYDICQNKQYCYTQVPTIVCIIRYGFETSKQKLHASLTFGSHEVVFIS